jgi:hypothetical protein
MIKIEIIIVYILCYYKLLLKNMSIDILSLLNLDTETVINDINTIIDDFNLFINNKLIEQQAKNNYGKLFVIDYIIPEAYIIKYGEFKCCEILFNYISERQKRIIYTNQDHENKVKFTTRYIGLKNTTKCDFIKDFYKIVVDNIQLPVIVPRETINNIIIKSKLLEDISDLSLQQKNKNNELDIIINNIKFKSVVLDDIQSLIQNRISSLDTINKTIDSFFDEEQYNLKKSIYIAQYNDGLLYLDVDKILCDLGDNCCDIIDLTNNLLVIDTNYNDTSPTPDYKSFVKKQFKLNFPVSIKLVHDEFVVKVFIKFKNNITKSSKNRDDIHYINSHFIDELNNISNKKVFAIVYLTNYGRFIMSDDLCYFNNKSLSQFQNTSIMNNQVMPTNFKIFENNNLVLVNTYCNVVNVHRNGFEQARYDIIYKTIQIKYDIIKPDMLTYKLPSLFIDVIKSYESNDTNSMQQCCKKYLEISKITDTKEKIIKDEIIRQKDVDINRLLTQITDMNVIIDEKDEDIISLNEQLQKIKQELDDLKIKYDKIKNILNI